MPPEDLPPYLDTRSYDSTDNDREQIAIDDIEKEMSGDELSPYSSNTSRNKTFNLNTLSSMTLVPLPSYKSLNLLQTPTKFNAINKQNRDKYIICKPRDQNRLTLSEAIRKTAETAQIDDSEWLASHIIAVYFGTSWLRDSLNSLVQKQEWKRVMNGPTLQAKRKSGRKNNQIPIDSHVFSWTFPPSEKNSKSHKDMTSTEYITVALDECKRYIADKNLFPTKVGVRFDSEFLVVATRILHLCQIVLSHFYTRDLFNVLSTNHLHTRLNMVFSHLLLIDEIFGLNVIDRSKHPLFDLIPILVDPE